LYYLTTEQDPDKMFRFIVIFSLAFLATKANGQKHLTAEDFERAKHLDFKKLVAEYAENNRTAQLITSPEQQKLDIKGV
jgi:hypothetical protein